MAYSNAAETVARAMAEKRGKSIMLMDVKDVSPIASEFVVATANSDVHMRTLCDAAGEALEKMGLSYSQEGQNSVMWRLIDAGDLLVHVFSVGGREFYDLERIWGDRPIKRLEDVD